MDRGFFLAGLDSEFILRVSAKEAKDAGLSKDREYEICRATEGVWVLVERKGETHKKGNSAKKEDNASERILSMIGELPLSERVEGKFEKTLGKEALQAFNSLLKEGKIEKFRLNPSYKKAVYQLPKTGNSPNSPAAPQNPPKVNAQKEDGTLTLGDEGYMVISNEPAARKFSMDNEEKIKRKEIRGTRSFDGGFYIISAELYDGQMPKLLQRIKKERVVNVEELSRAMKMEPVLAKIICEFLREEGELIERKKGFYEYVE